MCASGMQAVILAIQAIQNGLARMVLCGGVESMSTAPYLRISPDPNEFDMIELNQAFAAQALACIRELKLDKAKVNTDGGAIALGHPIGAPGARLLVHVAHRRPRRGLATLCIGGGMGCAVVLERGSTAA